MLIWRYGRIEEKWSADLKSGEPALPSRPSRHHWPAGRERAEAVDPSQVPQGRLEYQLGCDCGGKRRAGGPGPERLAWDRPNDTSWGSSR